jgi:hypothetical protein
MGEWCQRPVSGEAETDNVIPGTQTRRRFCHGLAYVRDPELRPRVSRRCFETPLYEASDEAGRWAGMLTRLAGGPTRENLTHRFL